MEDNEIVKLYLMRSEEALQKTAEKYGAYLKSVAVNIAGSEQDAEECVNDTYLSAWNSIPPHQPAVLKTYLCKLCRNHALMRLRYNNAARRGGGQVPAALEEIEELIPGETGDEEQSKAIREAVGSFVKELSDTERCVFLARYFRFSDIKTVSAEYGFTQSKVKMILKRCRDKLKKKLERQGLM